MACQFVDDKEQWNKFAAGQSHAQFLQSFEWGEFQKASGRRVWRAGVFERCHPDPTSAGEGYLAASDKRFFPFTPPAGGVQGFGSLAQSLP